MVEQNGGWIQTFTGRKFYPLAPRPEDIVIEDIAHALSMSCRYNGHVRRFYSVAEHCYLVSSYVQHVAPDNYEQQLLALLHDAAEAYLADVPSPVKPQLVGYRAAEERCEQAIATAFGLPSLAKTPLIHDIDTRIRIDEVKELMSHDVDRWTSRLGEPLGVYVAGVPPGHAKQWFLMKFRLLIRRVGGISDPR